MENGWVKLHRKILENPIVRKPNYLALWVVLLLKANHKDNKMIWNNDILIIKEGQLLTGRKELSKETGIPEGTLEGILTAMEKNQHLIQQQKTTKYRIITILNWKNYQHSDNTSDNKPTTNQQQTDTNKNDNKDKNEKTINTTEPSSEEIGILIKSFEGINPNAKNFYARNPQRKACVQLINLIGFERIKGVIENTLPKTNKIEYMPTITTPIQLLEKWSSLEAGILKLKGKQKEKSKVAFQ